MKIPKSLVGFHWSMLLIAGCATLQPSDQQSHSCHHEPGLLRDTVYIAAQLDNVDPPTPRPPHLAPYPPAVAGEFKIQVGDASYFAWGMPVRVVREGSDQDRLVRFGNAGAIPLYILAPDFIEGHRHTLWAPVTETCVLLPFRHESEMR